jgi:hypothetical protein
MTDAPCNSDLDPQSPTVVSSQPTPSTNPGRRCRWWRRGITIAVVLLLVLWQRDFLCWALATPLIRSESGANATAILLIQGHYPFAEVATFLTQDDHHRVLIEASPQGRLERLGIFAPAEETGRKEMVKLGAKPEQIQVLDWTGGGSRSAAIQRWLMDHPDEQLLVLSEGFSSRELRWQMDRELPASIARRIAIRPSTRQLYDASNWWQTKRGTIAFLRGWLGLILPVIRCGQQKEWVECNPEQFQPGPG